MNRSLRFLFVLLALAAALVFGGSSRGDLPPSPLIKLNAPANGAVVPEAAGSITIAPKPTPTPAQKPPR